MTRRSFAALLAASVLSLGAARAQDVPVGAVEILSGPNAAYGTAIRAGLELALGTVNQAGVLDGKKIKLTVEDSAGNKDQAVNATRLLIGRDKVVSIIGPTLSTEMFAAGPVANERHVPIIGTSTTANGIAEIGPYVFRTALPESDVIPVTFKAAQQTFGVKSVAIMYAVDDAVSKSGFDVMKATAEKMGMKVVAIESFASKDTDFSAQLTKIRSLGPDAIAISALVEPVSGVLLQARQLGISDKTLFIGGNGSNSPKLGQIAGAAADGLIVGSPWFIGKQDPKNEAFVKAFRAKYNKDPDQFAAQAFDTMFILAQAIDRAGAADPGKVREALLKTNYDGVMGHFTFNADRSPAENSGVVVLRWEGNGFQILK